jgi:hypothetical protein
MKILNTLRLGFGLLAFLAVGVSALAFADTCPQGQFTCNVDEPYSTTCCNSDQVCGVSNHGKAQCTIPKPKERAPSKISTRQASPKDKKDNSDKK